MDIYFRPNCDHWPWYCIYDKGLLYKPGVVSYGNYEPGLFEGTYFQTLQYVKNTAYVIGVDCDNDIVTYLHVPSYTSSVKISTDEYHYSWSPFDNDSLAQMRHLPYYFDLKLPKLTLPTANSMSLDVPGLSKGWLLCHAVSKTEVIKSFACPHRIRLPQDPTDFFLNLKISIQFSEALLTEASYVLVQHNAVRRCTPSS